MNREDIAIRRRCQEALDSLALEREREAALVQRLEPMIRDAEAWQADELAFRHMDEEHAETLRKIGFALPRPPEESRARLEARIAELEAEVSDSRRRQEAFEAYARVLAEHGG